MGMKCKEPYCGGEIREVYYEKGSYECTFCGTRYTTKKSRQENDIVDDAIGFGLGLLLGGLGGGSSSSDSDSSSDSGFSGGGGDSAGGGASEDW